jgi:hypothetical protein
VFDKNKYWFNKKNAQYVKKMREKFAQLSEKQYFYSQTDIAL